MRHAGLLPVSASAGGAVPSGAAGLTFGSVCSGIEAAMNLKRCSLCRQEKPLDDFHRQAKLKSGRHSWCKPCYNARHPKKKQLSSERRRELNYFSRYRLTVSDVTARLERQGGECALCGTNLREKRYHVDHNHETGEVRGILCHRCNIHLPFVEDAEWLRRATDYLERSKGR